MSNSHPWRAGAAVTLALALGACASVPPPKEELAVTRSILEQARGAGAAGASNYELTTAEQKYDRAQRAMRDEQYMEARRLAQEAEVDARLALAKANTTKARAAVAEVQDSIRVLRDELNRTAPATTTTTPR